MSERGSQLDLASEAKTRGGVKGSSQRPFLGVTFNCCGVYGRIYPNRQGDAYEGRCPRCLSPIRAEIGPGGSSNRFFTAQ